MDPSSGDAAPPPDDGRTSILLSAVRRGDREALWELMRRERPWIERLVRARLGPTQRLLHDTGDVVHDAFLRVLRRGPRLGIRSRERFQQFMARVVLNDLGSKLRPRSRSPVARGVHRVVIDLDTGMTSSAIEPPEAAARAEEAAWLMIAIELADDRDRDIVRAHAIEELEFVEISRLFGMTPDAVRKRFGRALEKLALSIERMRVRGVGAMLDTAAATESRSSPDS